MSVQQSVFVTGSSSGIGRSICETLARKGHIVFATMRQVSRKNAAAAQELQTLAQQENLALHVIELDNTDDASVARAVDAALSIAGKIDVVVNNAGVMAIGVSEAMTVSQVQQMYDVNVLGAFRVNQAVLPHMRERGAGYLIYVSSTGSLIVYPFMGMYGATKAAFSSMAEALHYEVYSLGIDTTILQCGGYATSLPNNVQVGTREGIAETYGGMSGAIANAVVGGFSTNLAAAGDPNEVGNLIADLMERPHGQRPLRQPVGPFSEPIHPANEALGAMQGQVLAAMQLDGLTKR
jgi:NAD(P)-dependent dehydrogenase (short-subunit alcohol dehydrogenase family)